MPASWKVVVAIVFTSPKPALTQAGFCIQSATVFIAVVIFWSENFTWWPTHWSYTSPPYEPSTTSSSQSVAGQPVAVPEAMPPHHGLGPPALAIRSLSAIRSAQVFGVS